MRDWKAIRRRRGWLHIKQHGEGVSPEEVQLLFARIIPWAMSMHGQELKILAFSWDFDELKQGEAAPEYIPRVHTRPANADGSPWPEWEPTNYIRFERVRAAA